MKENWNIGLLAFKISRKLTMGFSGLCLRSCRQQGKAMDTAVGILYVCNTALKCALVWIPQIAPQEMRFWSQDGI